MNHSTVQDNSLHAINDDVLRYSNGSPDLFEGVDEDDDNILNPTEVDNETPTENILDILNENLQNESQNSDVIPPSIESEFVFAIPGKLLSELFERKPYNNILNSSNV